MEMQDQRRMRAEFFSLIHKHFAGENARVAYVLTSMGKPVSHRTVQAWLIDPQRRSSRTLPPWVLPMLTAYIENSKKSELPPLPRDHHDPDAHAAWLCITNSVEIADQQIERENLIRNKWANANISEIPKMMSDLEIRIENESEIFGMLSDSLREAMNESNDFESFKKNLIKRRDAGFRVMNDIRTVRRDIENNTNEFSNSEGLPTVPNKQKN